MLHRTAEWLFRAAGNHQGRTRMSGSGRLSTGQPPRALMLATGEEVPRGQSLRARLLIVDLKLGEVDRLLLNECQKAAQEGRMAAAMGAFLTWVAERYEELQERMRTRARETRNETMSYRSHARLRAILRELQAGWEIWLQFALEAGGIDGREQVELADQVRRALGELAVLQAPYQTAGEPTLRFVALLRVALATGGPHVEDRQRRVPERHHHGAGDASRVAASGSRPAPGSGGLIVATCTSIRRPTMRWPRRRPGWNGSL